MERTCIGCSGTDDHPRHLVWLPGDAEVTWHMDCHVIATGCPTCKAQLKGAEGLKGDDLRAHLTAKEA